MKTTLYVDDNEDDLEFFKIAAERCGANARLFREPASMIKFIEETAVPDIIFLDFSLQSGTATNVILQLRSRQLTKKVPIVILSDYEDKALINGCRKAGANYFINKPRSQRTYEKVLALILDIDWENFSPSDKDFSF